MDLEFYIKTAKHNYRASRIIKEIKNKSRLTIYRNQSNKLDVKDSEILWIISRPESIDLGRVWRGIDRRLDNIVGQTTGLIYDYHLHDAGLGYAPILEFRRTDRTIGVNWKVIWEKY